MPPSTAGSGCCSNYYVLEMNVTVFDLRTALLLTVLTVSVDSDVLDVLDVFRLFLDV